MQPTVNGIIAPGNLENGLVGSPTQSSLPSNLSSNVSQGQNLLGQLQQNTTPKPTPSSGGFWGDLQRLAPTIGSIALPTIADLATGGLATPFDIALAGIGGAGGQAIENATKGQNPLQMNDLTSGGLGAVGQGAGELLGVGMKAAGGALSKVATDAATQSTTDAASQAALDETNRIANEFSAVDPKQAQVGPALEKAKSLGITNPTAKDLSNLGSIYTYGNQSGAGVLDAIKSRALEQAGGTVDLSNTMNNLHTTLADPTNQLSLGSEEPVVASRGQLPKTPNNIATKIVQQVRNMLPGDTIDSSGQLTKTLSPTEADSLRQSVGKQISATAPGNPLSANYEAKLAENNVWRSVYRDISQATYNRPEVSAALNGITVGPDESAMIEDAINKSGITDPQVQANIKSDLTNIINNSKSGQDILSAEAPMVNVKNVGDIQTKEITDNPQTTASQKSLKAQAQAGIGNNLGNKALSKINPKTIMELAGGYESTLGNHPAVGIPLLAMSMLGGGSAAGIGGDILSSLGGKASADALASGADLSTVPMAQRALATIPGAIGSTIAMSPTTINPNGGGVNTNMNGSLQNSLLAQVLQQDLAAGNTALAAPGTAGQYSAQIGQLPGLLGIATKALAAQQSAQNMGNTANLAGVGQGPIMGLLSQLGQTLTGGPASLLNNTLSQQENQTQQALQQAGVSQGAPMPNMEQNRQTAQQTINGIRALLGSLGGGQASQLGGILGQ